MILKVLSVFDDKGAIYGMPMFVSNVNLAIRSFSDAVIESGSKLGVHACDFHLYVLGDFDNVSGKFISLDSPEFICHAVDFVKKE